ncbi:hypothetical protein HXX76_011051 [Chlamydomonas incerta]|uniref:W2 domain-containing protein n=1 Tax=Chlamydomonas incerta TaxID=51695 RepID=A0A835VXA4_CHLIN|nr:hypothetical protein HXX76_011051 [Chlamydomonas incerta]|eukprot:KAG2429283.1 hypothetical protein HXX76_011051 [Chlamydomonas incerta]
MMKIKKENIFLKCKACGFVSDVDPRHKLNTFILKNPPENKLKKEEQKLKKAEEERVKDAEALGEKEKKEKDKKKKDKDKKEKKDKKKKKEGEEGEDKGSEDEDEKSGEEDDDGVVWMTDTSTEAAKRRAQEQLTAATAALVTLGNLEAEQEAARRKAEREAKKTAEEEARKKAEEEKKAAEEAAARAAAAAQAAALASADPVVRLRALLADKDAPTVVKELKGMTVEGGVAGKMRVLYEAALVGSETKMDVTLKARKNIFAQFAQDPQSQLAQLIAMEHMFAVAAPERLKEAPYLLKQLYETDLVEEDVILAWAQKADAGKLLGVPADGGKAVRNAVAQVVEWLQSQEDEEDEEDDEDEDE